MNKNRVLSPGIPAIAAFCGLVAAGIGIAGMTGVFLDLPGLTGAFSGDRTASMSAAFIGIGLGLVLAGITTRTLTGVSRAVLAGLLCFIVLVPGTELPLNILRYLSPVEQLPVAAGSSLAAAPAMPVSLVAAGLILPAAVGLLLLLYAPELSAKNSRVRDIPGILGPGISGISFIFLSGSLYGAPLSSDPAFVPLSMVAFLFIGIGLTAAAGQTAALSGFFFGNSTQARLLRTAILLVIVILVCEELIRIILATTVPVNDALIPALVRTLFILLVIIVVGRVASDTGRSIDQARVQQNQMETELQAAYQQLAAQEEELRQQYRDLARNQQDLMEREVRYRTILKTAMDGFGLVDTDGKFQDVNDAFCSMLGYTREEMLNRSLQDIGACESPEIIAGHLNRILLQGSDRFEIQYRARSGRLIDAEVSAVSSTLRNAPLVTFHRDITERIRAEKAHDQAKKKLNLLNQVTFGDIRTATFSLRGYIQLILDDPADPQVSAYTRKLDALAETISHSLEFAHRFQSMGMKQPFWQNVNHVFIMAVSHLDFSAISRRVELNELEVFADPLLEPALQTLANLSISRGGGATEVSLTCMPRPDGSLSILYRDNGTGIPEPVKEQLFSRDRTQKSGMDLFLAREILEITGMSIAETGSAGQGLQFEIIVQKGGFRFPLQKTGPGPA